MFVSTGTLFLSRKGLILIKEKIFWEDLSLRENIFFKNAVLILLKSVSEMKLVFLCKQAELCPSSRFLQTRKFHLPRLSWLTPLAVAEPGDGERQLGYLIHPHVAASCSLQLICCYCPRMKSNQAQCGQRDSINSQKLPSREGCLEVPCQKE